MASVARPARPVLLLALVLAWSAPLQAEEPIERDLEPLPRSIVFTHPGADRPPLDARTDAEVRDAIQRAFASLGTVEEARALLVLRYGLVSVPALVDVLGANRNVTEVWNAALTVGALRDVEGSAYELLPAIRPLVKVLGSDGDPHTNAMAALALGCFHHHQEAAPDGSAAPSAADDPLPGVASQRQRAREALRDGRRMLANNLDHPLIFRRMACALALAKMGGPEAADEFWAMDAPAANPQPRRAHMLAGAFLGARDADLYRKQLLGVEARAAQTVEEATAALAMAVAMLQEEPAPWTREADDVLRHLRGIGDSLPEARAERVFAQGVCAYVNQANDAWDGVWEEAVRASADDEVAGAAAQILAHCRVPAIERRIIDILVSPQKTPHPPVLALALLRSGAMGHADALPKIAEWLRSKAKRPAANPRWDPRWYAVAGVLRALADGRIKAKADRVLVIDALRRAASNTLDRETPMRARLQALLDVHGQKIVDAEASAPYLLPRDELLRIESSFTCPYGLLAGDAIDACVLRVNRTVEDVFGLHNIPPWKPGGDNSKKQPERYLKRYLRAHPYIGRLEFRADRGRRPPPALPEGVPGIDR